MLWLVDLLIALLALVVLGLAGWSLFRHGRVLAHAVSAASRRVAEVMPSPPERQPRSRS